MPVGLHRRFVYHETMIVEDQSEIAVSAIAAAIGEPARTRMLYCLMDGRARTSTELATVGGVSPSTASVHLTRLRSAHLVKVIVQGKHRYYRLSGRSVARALEGLSVVAGCSRNGLVSTTPNRLRAARTCYDHVAGTIGVLLHHQFMTLQWLAPCETDPDAYAVTKAGVKGFVQLGIDIDATHLLRRRFAYPCLDWSERQPHIAGALGAALLELTMKKKWLTRDADSRALSLTRYGRRELAAQLGLIL